MDWGTMPPFNVWFGGKWSQRRFESTDRQIEQAQYAKDLQRGSNMIYWGILCCVACLVLHGATSSYHVIAGKFAKIFEWGIVGGIGLIIAGAWYKQTIEHEVWISIVSVCVAGFFLSRDKIKRWSLSHGIKWIAERASTPESQTQGSVPIEDVEFVCDTHSTES